jgi:hypothetical protein
MITKEFILELVENSKLKLDAKLSEFYPEIQNSKITIKKFVRAHERTRYFCNKKWRLIYRTK